MACQSRMGLGVYVVMKQTQCKDGKQVHLARESPPNCFEGENGNLGDQVRDYVACNMGVKDGK